MACQALEDLALLRRAPKLKAALEELRRSILKGLWQESSTFALRELATLAVVLKRHDPYRSCKWLVGGVGGHHFIQAMQSSHVRLVLKEVRIAFKARKGLKLHESRGRSGTEVKDLELKGPTYAIFLPIL